MFARPSFRTSISSGIKGYAHSILRQCILVRSNIFKMQRIEVHGAAYGGMDVTEKVRALVSRGVTTIEASNSVFGDPWYGTVKSLAVTYRTVQTVTCKEHEFIILPHGVQILGAAYGLADVTRKVESLYGCNQKSIQANNAVLGDSWPGTVKSFSVTFATNQAQTKVVPENSKLSLL